MDTSTHTDAHAHIHVYILICIHSYIQGEKSRFVIYDEVVDKYGNKPFWGSGPVALEIRYICVFVCMCVPICTHVA
jgi:hypothetical protein